jgi:2-(1,2-epoxy-1,2-dihydrophenyl)acetyl-CoA isomerase
MTTASNTPASGTTASDAAAGSAAASFPPASVPVAVQRTAQALPDVDTLLVTYSASVARITLNRPERLNSLTAQMFADLAAVLSFLEAQSDLRGVVLTGAGRGFCAGQDQQERPPLPDGQRRDLGIGLDQNYRPLVLRLRALPVPVVCVVNGVAAGAGLSLALACDVVIAVESARFIQAFDKIGLLPDAGATWFLPRLIGQGRAMGWTLSGEPLTAQQAEQWGLIWQRIPDAQLDDTIAATAARLAAGPTRAHAAAKRALLASSDQTLEQQFDLERDLQRELGYSADYLEGITAFAQKRKPAFTGT